jgi:hypothetical protein
LYDLDLDESNPIPADQNVGPPQTYQCDGSEPHWRGIYDDENHLMVATNFNMDADSAYKRPLCLNLPLSRGNTGGGRPEAESARPGTVVTRMAKRSGLESPRLAPRA